MRPKVFSINPLGVSAEFYMYKDGKSSTKIITYLAGPIMNLCMAVIFVCVPIVDEIRMKIVYTNLLLAIFNLMPIMPLDGGKILKEILVKKVGNKKATIFMSQLTQVILVAITLLYSIAILHMRNFALFLLIIYLWYLKHVEDRKIKSMIRAYEVLESKGG